MYGVKKPTLVMEVIVSLTLNLCMKAALSVANKQGIIRLDGLHLYVELMFLILTIPYEKM